MRSFDVTGRWGGEEFVILMEKMNLEELTQRAEVLRRLVEGSNLEVNEERLSVTISIGATIARIGEKKDETIKRADTLLYRSKEDGRNRVTSAP